MPANRADITKMLGDGRKGDHAAANAGVAEVDGLLDRLERADALAARVVEMKVFAGLTDDEVAGGVRPLARDRAAALGVGASVAAAAPAEPYRSANRKRMTSFREWIRFIDKERKKP